MVLGIERRVGKGLQVGHRAEPRPTGPRSGAQGLREVGAIALERAGGCLGSAQRKAGVTAWVCEALVGRRHKWSGGEARVSCAIGRGGGGGGGSERLQQRFVGVTR